MSKLSHLDADGRARMVDVSDKPATAREAVAEGRVSMNPETLALALSGQGKKGAVADVWERNQGTGSGNREVSTLGCGLGTQVLDAGSFAF